MALWVEVWIVVRRRCHLQNLATCFENQIDIVERYTFLHAPPIRMCNPPIPVFFHCAESTNELGRAAKPLLKPPDPLSARLRERAIRYTVCGEKGFRRLIGNGNEYRWFVGYIAYQVRY